MVPQHDAAPSRQQRWIELRNVGGYTVPAWGVCQIVGSLRPESGGAYTPNGGRTVMLVQRPDQDDPCAVCVNGPCEIPPGKEGKPGTKDDPLLALVDQEYDPGTGLGVVKDSFVLTERGCIRFVADGDYSNGTMRVDRHDHCPNELIVKQLYECAKPGVESTAQPQKWDEDTGDYVDDLTMDEITVKDPLCWRLALKDEKYKVERDNCSQQSYRPSMPFGLTRRVKITEDTDCGVASLVTVMFKPPSEEVSCTWQDGGEDPCKIYACNTSNRRLACDAEYEYATMHITPGECVGWLVPDARPLFATATLSGDLCGESGAVSGVAVQDVCDWPWREEPTSVENPLARYGCTGQTVLLSWNSEECKWYVVAVQPTVLTADNLPMTDIRCKEDSCTVERNVWQGTAAIEWCDNCGETEWKDSSMTGEKVDIYTSNLDCTNCKLEVNKQTICVFCGATSEAQTPIDLVKIEVPTSIGTTSDGDGSTEDPYSCELSIATKKFCVLGCDMDQSGEDITLELDRIDPITSLEFGFDDPDTPTELCITPTTTPTFVLGCIETAEEGEPVCVAVDPCPEPEEPPEE